MEVKPRLSRDGTINPTIYGWRLAIPPGPSGRYRLSQLDDHLGLSRTAYPWHPPLTFSLRARHSSNSAPGTWGFGLWNDPFGFSFGPGDTFFRLPALPNTVWFFYASPKNYLSFRDDKPAHGFLAQVFRSPRFHPSLLLAGLTLPFSRKMSRRILSKVIVEDAFALSHDLTQWHDYRIEWRQSLSTFWVDDHLVFQSPVTPRSPLGIVIWIDNQYAALTPEGKLKWGMEINPESEWLEIEQVETKRIERE